MSFTTENTRSFRDEAHLSFIASEPAPDGVERGSIRVDEDDEVAILPTAGIFGANASGKSAILLALRDMEIIVRQSFARVHLFKEEPRSYFKLDSQSAARPTKLEVEVIVRGILWRYGFSYDDERITSEYALRSYPVNSEPQVVFMREGDQIDFGDSAGSSIELLRRFLRPSALLLSVAGAADESPLAGLYKWFHDHVFFTQGGNNSVSAAMTAKMAESRDKHKEGIMHLLAFADLGLTDIAWVPPSSELVESYRRHIDQISQITDGGGDSLTSTDKDKHESFIALHLGRARFGHNSSNGDIFLPQESESFGTLAWTGLIGKMLVALEDGDLLMVDELDCSLHPLLAAKAVEFFQAKEYNPHNAQLLFNSHDPNLIGGATNDTLPPDQIWFTEKARNGVSTLFSLADFKPEQPADASNAERYIRGDYGALPILSPTDLRQALPLG